MEELMYFVWQQGLMQSLCTTDGCPIEVLHPGLRNTGAGPDFFNAKVRYDGITWAGNIEMHVKSSDWNRHGHQDNRLYDSVILHVVLQHDQPIHLHDGTELKTVVMQIPDDVMARYRKLSDGQPTQANCTPILPGQHPPYQDFACRPRLHEISKIVLHDWMTSLAADRMLGKMKRIQNLVEGDLKSWEEGFYALLLRSLGAGTNGDAMECLARSLPYSCLLHHRDNLLQLRALLLGQAGLIASELPDSKQLAQEYNFLRTKFTLNPLDPKVWKMSRMRPYASPAVRLQAFATLIHHHPNLLNELSEATSLSQFEHILRTPGIGLQTLQVAIINAVIPALLSYFSWQGQEERYEQIFSLLSQLPPEANRFITQWQQAGIEAQNALQSQALLHLVLNYCQPHKCLQCRIGCWLVKHP